MPKKPGKQKGQPDQPAPAPQDPQKRYAVFQQEFREDLAYWIHTDRRIAERVLELVEAVMDDPFGGIGKPEPLKYIASNTWSRRLTQEHRFVYQVNNLRIDFLQCRYHY